MIDKLLTISLGIGAFLTWVGCCVGFGGVLSTATLSGFNAEFTYLKVSYGSNSYAFDSIEVSGLGISDCAGSGKGMVAMLVFAFFALTPALALYLLRIVNQWILGFGEKASLQIEAVLHAAALFFYFLAVCIYGGGCFSNIRSSNYFKDVAGTGFGYIIFCFFVQIYLFVIAIMSTRKPLQVSLFGSSSSASDGHYTSQYQDPGANNLHTNLTNSESSFPSSDNYQEPVPQQPQTGNEHTSFVVDKSCPSCAALVRCPTGGSTSCLVCGATVVA